MIDAPVLRAAVVVALLGWPAAVGAEESGSLAAKRAAAPSYGFLVAYPSRCAALAPRVGAVTGRMEVRYDFVVEDFDGDSPLGKGPIAAGRRRAAAAARRPGFCARLARELNAADRALQLR